MNPLIIETYKDRKGLWRWRAKRSGRIVADSGEGYSRRSKARRAVDNLCKAIAEYAVKYVPLLLLLALPAIAINSPRPASVRAVGEDLVLTWTNISEAHPWLLSYRHSLNQPWQWETTKLHAINRRLSVSVPMTNQQGYLRLWPAAPEQ